MKEQLSRESVEVVIDTDRVYISNSKGVGIILTYKEWHYLCDACAEYLGFNRVDIDAALKGVTEQ